MKITSRDNSLLRRARAVRDGKETASIFVEGLRLCEEALSSGLWIEALIYSEELARKQRAAPLIKKIEPVAKKSAVVSERLLQTISYTKTPQGIVLLATRPVWDAKHFNDQQPAEPLLVVLHGINNPVNVGAILRTAEAAGATGVITTQMTSDPFSPKALRGAMGSAFRLPVWKLTDYQDVMSYCKRRKITTVSADVSATTLFSEFEWRRASALVMGGESTGLSRAELAAADAAVRIPMQGSTESLNVAVAAGVILYEAAAQRGLINRGLAAARRKR